MSNYSNQLRINVGFLLNQPVGIYRDIHIDLADYLLSPDFQVTQLKGTIRLGRTPQGIIAQGNFTAFKEATCVRCLDDFQQDLHTEFAELFTLHNQPLTEEGLVVPEDGNLDFASLVRDYLLVEDPIKPLCRQDCKGLCIECGENLNKVTCEHQSQLVKIQTGD